MKNSLWGSPGLWVLLLLQVLLLQVLQPPGTGSPGCALSIPPFHRCFHGAKSHQEMPQAFSQHWEALQAPSLCPSVPAPVAEPRCAVLWQSWS